MNYREVDPNEAPEGHYAEAATWEASQASCKGCAFEQPCNEGECDSANCTPLKRKDGQYVILKAKGA